MVEGWRIVKAHYVEDAFSGEGARRAGGRFNSPGVPIVYTASSLALAELEILVNLPTPRLLGSYVAFRVRIPDEHVETLAQTDLPENWRADPASRAIKAVGDRWIRKGRALVLAGPSAVVPAERNYLLNPQHEGFADLAIDGPFNPDIDPRLRRSSLRLTKNPPCGDAGPVHPPKNSCLLRNYLKTIKAVMLSSTKHLLKAIGPIRRDPSRPFRMTCGVLR